MRDGGSTVGLVRQEELERPKVVLDSPVIRLGLPVVELANQRQRLDTREEGGGGGGWWWWGGDATGVPVCLQRTCPSSQTGFGSSLLLQQHLSHQQWCWLPPSQRCPASARIPWHQAPTRGTRCPSCPRARRGSGRRTGSLHMREEGEGGFRMGMANQGQRGK